MIEKSGRPRHLFVVRLWQEPSRAAPPGQWRGSVEHVHSGERQYFSELSDLMGFMARQLDPQTAGPKHSAPG